MSMSSHTIRGALIGGVVGVIFHLIVRFIFQNLVWIALGVMLIWVLAKFSPESPRDVAKRARLNSVDRSAVMVLNAQGVTASYSPHVEAVAATIQNTGRARIYDLRLYCSFRPLPPSSPSKSEGSWDIDHVRTSYHYGYVNPGQTISARLTPEPNGYLSEANPSSFNCVPLFEVERTDLLKDHQ
jgi:hypothetical protein